jgi:hypothetical protein
MASKQLDPGIVNIFLDACAFDPKYFPEDQAALNLFQRFEKGDLLLQIAHSTQKEIEHPNTPSWVKQQSSGLIYTIETSLTDAERRVQELILTILAGNGKRDNVLQDSKHVFEAAKYGSYLNSEEKRRASLCV